MRIDIGSGRGPWMCVGLIAATVLASGCRNTDATKKDGSEAEAAKVSDTKTSPPEPEPAASPDASPTVDGTTLPGQVVEAAPGLRGVDTFAAISAEQAKAIQAAGYAFAVRYIAHAGSKERHITRAEAEGILASGMALMLVQGGRGFHETVPSTELGHEDGQAAVEEASALGYPAEAVVWLDVEGVAAEGATAQSVIEYATAWHEEVSGHFAPGYYVGPGGKLDAEQLGALPFEHFWKSGTKVPTPEGRGYQITQHPPQDVGGVTVDIDLTQNDAEGGAVSWLAPEGS